MSCHLLPPWVHINSKLDWEREPRLKPRHSDRDESGLTASPNTCIHLNYLKSFFFGRDRNRDIPTTDFTTLMSATARDGQAKARILDLHLGLPHGWQGDWYWSHHPLPSRCALIGIWNPEGTGREPSFCWSKKQSRTLIQDNVGCWCPKWHPNYYAKHPPPILAISELCSSYHQHTSMDLNQKLLLTLLRFFVRLTENRAHSVQSHFSHSYKVWCGRKIWIINVNRKLVHPVCKALIKLQPHQQSMWLLRPSESQWEEN